MGKMPLAFSFLSLTCIVGASATDQAHGNALHMKMGSQRNALWNRMAVAVDANGHIEVTKSELVQRADNLAQPVANASVEQKGSKAAVASDEKEIKAHVLVGQVENSTDKANGTIVRIESAQKQDSLRQKFMDVMDSWEHRLFAWKHNLIEKTEAKTNSLWERIQSNATADFPLELVPEEYLSTQCHETNTIELLPECWEKKPKDLPACKDLPKTVFDDAQFAKGAACRCSDHGDDLCNVNALTQTMLGEGRCVDLRVYINKAGKKEEAHCAKMVKNKDWKAMGLVAQEGDGPANKEMPWYKWCGFGYVKKDGECRRKQRFLTESCWGSNGHGACVGSDIAHDEFSTSCYNGQCVPQSFVQTEVECSCSSTGWHFPFACTAKNDQCGGHPCLWNEGRGQMFCNFAEKQNWNDATNVIASVVIIGLTCSLLTAIGVMFWMIMPSLVKASIMHELGMTKTI